MLQIARVVRQTSFTDLFFYFCYMFFYDADSSRAEPSLALCFDKESLL